MKVVLDTNIYISGYIFPGEKTSLVLDLAQKKEFEVYCSPFIIEKVRRMLTTKFEYKEFIANQFIEQILLFAHVIYPNKEVNIIKTNIDDNQILNCVLTVKADYLITGDKKHLLPIKKVGKTKIVSVTEFLEIFKSLDSANLV